MPGAEHRVEQAVDLRAQDGLRVGHHVGAEPAVGRRELLSSCAAMADRLRPGLRRRSRPASGARSPGRTGPVPAACASGSIASGVHSASRIGKANFGGITPMTVRIDAVGANRRADDGRRAAVAVAPERVAEQDDRLGARAIVAVAEAAAEHRFDAERLERRDASSARP